MCGWLILLNINNFSLRHVRFLLFKAAPTFFYIELTNFYQNHRLYLKSKSIEQLLGDLSSPSTIKTSCSPVSTNE